jgi:drug/metabolite transporter (DMT)-like permease
MRNSFFRSDPMSESRCRGFVFLAGVLWSFGGLIVHSINNSSEWQVLFYRSFAIVLISAFLALTLRLNIIGSFIKIGMWGKMGVLFKSCSTIFMLFALANASVAGVLLIIACSPFFAALFARMFLSERIDTVTGMSIIVAFCGVGLIVYHNYVVPDMLGMGYALVAVVFFALYSVSLRSGSKTNMLSTLVIAETLTATISFFVLMIAGDGLSISSHDLVLAIMLGLVSSGLGTLLYTIASKKIAAAELTLIALSEIALGPVWVWFILQEQPDAYTLFGGGFILSAIITNALYKRPNVIREQAAN